MTTARFSSTAARVALVTGANKGIGKAIAAGLAEHGFTVYLGSRHPGRGQAAATELATFGDVRALTLDVTSDTDTAAAVRRIQAETGHLDVLVNNNVTSKRGSIGEDGAWAGQPVMSYSSSKTASTRSPPTMPARWLAPRSR